MRHPLSRRALLAGTAALAFAPTARSRPARARPAYAADKPLRVGLLNDMNGVFADYQGRGSVIAAQLAIEDHGALAGRPVELLTADHQNKPDIGMAIARRWYDDGVDVILDVPNSAIALAIAALANDRNRVFIGSGAGIADLTGTRCAPTTVHWTYDTWEVGHALGRALTERGSKTWFTVTADYSFGADLDKNVTEAVVQAGGRVIGGLKHPFPNSDFSSVLLAAGASGAEVLCLNNAGDDQTTALKQAAEFGLTKRMKVTGPVYNVNMVHGVGLPVAAGVLGVTPFYWDMTDDTRTFARTFQSRDPRRAMPNDMQAGCYSALVHLFKAVAKAGPAADGPAIVAAMKAISTDDKLFGKGTVRADGRKLHPVYLVQTKTPAESTSEWDFFKVVATIPADQAFRPMTPGLCKMVPA